MGTRTECAMRLRAFLVWSVLPVLVLGVGLAVFATRSVDSQRREISRLAAATDRAGVLQQANGWATSRATTLLALGAFRSAPLELQTLAASANLLRDQLDRSTLLTSFSTSEAESTKVLRKLEALGPVAPEVRRVLSPLPPIAVAALRRGDQAFLDPGPDVATLAWFRDETRTAQDAAAAASRKLRNLGDDPPLWRDPAFDLVAGLLFVVVLALWIAGAWRISVAARAARAELDAERRSFHEAAAAQRGPAIPHRRRPPGHRRARAGAVRPRRWPPSSVSWSAVIS